MQDKYQRYQDGVGSVRNSLSNYQNSGDEIGRGAFELDFITNPLSLGNDVTSYIQFHSRLLVAIHGYRAFAYLTYVLFQPKIGGWSYWCEKYGRAV